MRVLNLISSKGNKVPNQFEVISDKGRFFQSYKSMIVFIPNDGSPVQLGSDWDYSRTTSKYRNQFLGESTKEIESKLNKGIYILNNNL
tara:strand:- start:1022 stop:1285 length:264 start_codon:yes stop_codon:yes gene_type:complete